LKTTFNFVAMSRLVACLALVVACALRVGGACAATTPEQVQTAVRVQALLRGMSDEYGEAFDESGGLARPIELEEAGLLLTEARDLLPRLGIEAAALDPIAHAIATHTTRAAVEATARALSARVTDATGVTAEVRPPRPPSIARGATMFHENCESCHGEDGSGQGAEAQRLGLKPANFTDRTFIRGETPEDFFNVVTLGRRRSGMPAWGDALSVEERWDAVRFVWTRTADVPAARFDAACGGCHGDATPLMTSLGSRSDRALFDALSDPTRGGGAHAAPAALPEAERWQLVAAMRARAFDAFADASAAATQPLAATAPRPALAEVGQLVDKALATRAGDAAGAAALATDAYMRFEPFEKRLGATHPSLVRRIEESFVQLRRDVRDETVGSSALAAVAATIHRDLDEAVATLEPERGGWVRFVESATIILREGFEVVLVVGALLAYVRRGGTPTLVRALYLGSAAGVVASVATAALLVTVLRPTPGAGDVLEGAAMLLAAVVLFWVSYWLVSKAEADRWQHYIQGKVKSALSAGSGTALAAAAFLAVYREGFETILFYQALFASAPPGDVMVPAGLVAGIVLLAIVYAGLERLGVRIPMRTFFLATGGFLYAMAIVFAGRGVAELQDGGVASFTPLAWAPRIEVLGLYPTVETLAAQAVFVVLLVYAVVVTLRRRPTGTEAQPSPAPVG
jgi:high-affinity iron transporter